MFDIGWSELLIVGIVALIVIGPKELPGVLRAIGHWMTKIRRMASEFQGQFQDAMREAEMADLKKEVDDMAAQAEGFAQFDPMDSVRKDIEGSVDGAQTVKSTAADTPEPTTKEDVLPAAPEPVSTPGTDIPPHAETPAEPQADLATVGDRPKPGPEGAT